MQFSIFLVLLPFTLSAPSPYKMSFHSYLHAVPYMQETTFKITDHGIFIWKIPEVDGIYDELNNNFKHNIDFILANTLSAELPVTVKPLHFTLAEWQDKRISLDTSETYILLKVKLNNNCVGFYWLGNQSKLAKRQLTARLVVRMMYDLGLQMKEAKLVHLSREEENKESAIFQDHFNTGRSGSNVRLFKITGSYAQFIMEVPLKYNELYTSGTFVLDKKGTVYIWSADSSHNDETFFKIKAFALKKYLTKYEMPSRTRQVRSADKLNKEEFIEFQDQFLDVIQDVPSSKELPTVFTVMPDAVLQDEILRLWQLFEYMLINDWVFSIEMTNRPLILENFHQNKAYVMTDSISGKIFVYFGKNASYQQMEQATAAAEIIYLDSEEHEWTNVTIIRQADYPKWPLHFIIHFSNVDKILGRIMSHKQ